MKAPVILVSISLAVAILVATSLLVATTTRGQPASFTSSAGPLDVQTVASGLENPWALAFLPDGQMLVTERPGRMRVISRDGKLSAPLGGVPKPVAGGQAGLLDLALDKDFAANRTLYFCFSSDQGGNASVARAMLEDKQTRLDAVKVIFTQKGPGGQANHGCRIAQAPDGNLFVALGDHFGPRDQAQNLATDNGKLVRIAPDGSIPKDNPFVGRDGANPAIWSYGLRNAQSLAFNPASGDLWEIEHGPRGGDEVNIIGKGKNYGWPVIGYGIDYSGAKIHDSTSKPGMEQPIKYWVPSIAPSGMAFYDGSLFPAWKGSLFAGALAGQMLVRLSLNGDKVTGEERLLQNLEERIRDVRQGPDGALWLLTDTAEGRLLRIAPKAK